MKKRFDAVATVGKYRAQDGTEKKRYLTVGAVFEDDNRRLALKLDGLPVSPDWSGWISFYEPDRQQARPAQDSHNQAKSNGYQPQPEDEDIPF